MSKKTALILVDLQNDFCEGGKLPVPDASAVIPLANRLQAHFDVVLATKDWHPKDHASFAANHPGKKVGDLVMVNNIEQVLWPMHCVQNTKGAEFHPNLDTSLIEKIFFKGSDKMIDSYSAFFDNAHLRSTGLTEYLQAEGIKTIYIMGLATDYCVKHSCYDAVQFGFDTYVIEDACRGVNLNRDDVERSINALRAEGVKIIRSTDIWDEHE